MKNIRTASAIMLVMIAIFACLTSGSILADDAPEIDEWLYCNDEIKWGPACGINLQCFGYADGAVRVRYPVYEQLFGVYWAFEHFNPEFPNYTPLVCDGITNFYPPETPWLHANCKGNDGVRIIVNLRGCDFNWNLY